MRSELMSLTEKAINLLEDVAARGVWLVEQRSATYVMNGRTGRRVTASIRYLEGIGAVQRADETRGGRPLYAITDDAKEALAWHRKFRRPDPRRDER